jgi:hypothetical protein
LSLACNKSGSTITSDQFAIDFPFRAGYKYLVTISCLVPLETGNNPSYAKIFAEITNDTYSSSSCSTYQTTTNVRDSLKQPIHKNDHTAFETLLWTYTPTQAKSRLEIGAMPTADVYRFVYVESVTIQIIGLPDLTITPDALPLSCGSSASQTFTVTNNSNVSDISSVVWTLPANNGWSHAIQGSNPTSIKQEQI